MSDREIVLALEKTWGIAPLEGDTETVNNVVAEDWFAISTTGETMDKSTLLKNLISNQHIFDSLHYDDIKIKIFENTAVVTSSFEGIGKELTLNQRFMRVYSKRDATWKCVATQIVAAA